MSVGFDIFPVLAYPIFLLTLTWNARFFTTFKHMSYQDDGIDDAKVWVPPIDHDCPWFQLRRAICENFYTQPLHWAALHWKKVFPWFIPIQKYFIVNFPLLQSHALRMISEVWRNSIFEMCGKVFVLCTQCLECLLALFDIFAYNEWYIKMIIFVHNVSGFEVIKSFFFSMASFSIGLQRVCERECYWSDPAKARLK